MTELDYEIDSKIDVNALDIEWLNHSDMERKYIEQVSEFKRKLILATEKEKIAHEKLKTTRSILVQRAHSNPEKYIGKAKATGPEVEAFYRINKKYIKAKKRHIRAEMRVIEAEEEHNTARDMKDLMHFTKTKAIEQLVYLMSQEYFSGPKTPRNINKEILKKEGQDKKRMNRSSKIGSGMKRNSR